MKKGKIITVIILVIAAAAGVYWYIRRKTNSDPEQSTTAGGNGGSSAPAGSKPAGSSAPAPVPTDNAFPLATGSRGKYVLALQQLLKDKYKASIAVDGVFGPKTKEALTRAFKIYSVKDLAEFNSLFQR